MVCKGSKKNSTKKSTNTTNKSIGRKYSCGGKLKK